MSRWNAVKFEGNVGKEPTTRETQKGNKLTTFSLAVYQGKEKPTIWLEVKTTQACDVSRGSKVEVQGSLSLDEWTGHDGTKRTTWGVWADSVRAIDAQPPEDVKF